MCKGKVLDQGNIPQVMLPCRIQLLQPQNQRVPEHVRVRIDEEVPVPPGAQLPRLLRHVDVLVLVQVPSRVPLVLDVLGAVLLVDETISLRAVEVELAVVLLGFGKHVVEGVPNLDPRDGFLLVREDEQLRDAPHRGQELRRDLSKRFRRARLHDDGNVADVRKSLAQRVVNHYGPVRDGKIHEPGESILLLLLRQRRRCRPRCSG